MRVQHGNLLHHNTTQFGLFTDLLTMATDKSNIQGDLFSRGFPKYNESYYFFTIVESHAAVFSQKLAGLVKDKEISTLDKVLADWAAIEKHKPTPYAVSNVLIAFSMAGLQTVSAVGQSSPRS